MISLDLSVSRILLKFVISVTVVWSSGVSCKDYSMESAHKHIYSQVVMHQFHTYWDIFHTDHSRLEASNCDKQ